MWRLIELQIATWGVFGSLTIIDFNISINICRFHSQDEDKKSTSCDELFLVPFTWIDVHEFCGSVGLSEKNYDLAPLVLLYACMFYSTSYNLFMLLGDFDCEIDWKAPKDLCANN